MGGKLLTIAFIAVVTVAALDGIRRVAGESAADFVATFALAGASYALGRKHGEPTPTPLEERG